MGNEVDLTNFGQGRGRGRESRVGQQLFSLGHRHIAFRHAMRSPAGMTEFEEKLGGLIFVHGVEQSAFSYQLAAISHFWAAYAAASPSISAFVRFSVIAKVTQSASWGYQWARGRPAW